MQHRPRHRAANSGRARSVHAGNKSTDARLHEILDTEAGGDTQDARDADVDGPKDWDPDLTERIPPYRSWRSWRSWRTAWVMARRSGLLRRILVGTRRTLAGLLSLAVLAGTGYGWNSLHHLQNNLNTTDVIPAAPAGTLSDGATDILLVGSDSRTDANGNPLPLEVLKQLRTEESAGLNTDTIILVRVPDDGGNAFAVSIPRDTYVPIPGYREDKINVTYGVSRRSARDRLRAKGITDEHRLDRESTQAGQRALVQTVAELSGVQIDHYAEINLYGFYLLTQAIGGVEVCLRRSTTDSDSGANFRKGRQLVSGGDALAFVRQRKNLPRGDLDRIVRQQVFMAALANRILDAGTLADPGKLSALVDAVQKSIVLDDDWDVLAFAGQLQGIAAGDVQFVTIPVREVDARNERGQSIITVDRAEVHAFVANLIGKASQTEPSTPPPVTSSRPATPATPATPTTLPTPPAQQNAQSVVVSVYNASTNGGLAGRVVGVLAGQGFRTGQADNFPHRRDHSEIVVGPGAFAVGEQISAALGGLPSIVEDPTLAADRAKVIVGADYLGPGAQALAAPGLISLDGTPYLNGQPTPSPAPPATGDDAPITAEGVTCVN